MDKLMKLHAIKPQRLGWAPAAKELYEAELKRVFPRLISASYGAALLRR